MGKHFFAVGKPIGGKRGRERDRIAREVGGAGCGFVSVNQAGTRSSWGFCPNRGEPFDSRTAREITEAWDAAGV
ncbi:MAG: hypothetical protein ABIL09_13395 [Gemmatimonadota bacterium]